MRAVGIVDFLLADPTHDRGCRVEVSINGSTRRLALPGALSVCVGLGLDSVGAEGSEGNAGGINDWFDGCRGVSGA